MFWKILILLMTTKFSFSLAPNEILILILSQPNEYNNQLAYNLRLDILNQSLLVSKDNLVNVYLTHELFNHIGDWTILYLLPNLMKTNLISANIKWIIFCEDQSKVNLINLLKGLNNIDHLKEIYLGYPLYDREATIIHHFAFFEYPKWFPYPLLRAGIAFSKPLINTLEKLITEKTRLPRTEFFIDASHELSFFIWQNIKIENNKWKISSLTIKENQLKYSITIESENSINDDHHNASDKMEIYTESDSKYNKDANSAKNKTQHLAIDRNSKRKYSANKNENIFTEYNKQTNIPNDENRISSNTIVYHEKINNIGTKSSATKNSNNLIDKNGTTKDLVDIKKQLLLVNASSYFCTEKGNNCAIYPNRMQGNNTLCAPINPKTIYFAIKTCQKFHKERVPIIEATWGQYTPIKRYFSDIRDVYIPTILTGVPNTDTGHCSKALEIIKIAVNEIDIVNKNNDFEIKWIVLSDDDTLLSISAICDILGCFNPLHYVYLGERYGYRIHAKDGFNYITGGGGIVFSIPTARKIIKYCSCPQDSSPDDMIIGTCLKNLGIIPIHSSKFHQARPGDYPPEGLKIETPVSFHKFWQIDPINVYKSFLNGSLDQNLPYIYKYKSIIKKIFKTVDSNISKNCDDIQIPVKFNKAQQKIKNGNLEHRRKLQAFSRSTTTLIPKSKLFQHIDL